MSNDLQLPGHALLFQGVPHYTADQMREYGRACERAAYERAAELVIAICEDDLLAAAIRALGADK